MCTAALGAGCATRGPQAPAVSRRTFDVGGSAVRGVAGDLTRTFAALSHGHANTSIEARWARGSVQGFAWETKLEGAAGPLASAGSLVAVAVTATNTAGGGPVIGEPGAAVIGLDRDRGTVRWRAPLDASEWVIVTSIAATSDAVLVSGSFSGSLRIGNHTVSSAGNSDGFVAKLTTTGATTWVVRAGGLGADSIQGVASTGHRIAIAGVFAPGAELRGHPFESIEPKVPFADGFVAELDDTGARRWSASFGSKLDDAVAGVTIDGAGRVAVAATVRDAVQIGGAQLQTRGGSVGLVGWWSAEGSSLHAVLFGGDVPDGLL
ncbi:MAG: hypothetical protein AB7O24_15575, partial [Kofleriaceae bacterium]